MATISSCIRRMLMQELIDKSVALV